MSTKAVSLALIAHCLILAIGWPAAYADEQQALLVDPTDSSCCDEIVFASRNAPEDHHWYANFGYYARDSRGYTHSEKGQLCKLNLSTKELKHSEWLHEPRPIRSRPRERVIPSKVNLHDSTGKLVLLDVYHGRNMKGVKRGDIKKLLILEQLPKPINFTGNSLMVVSYMKMWVPSGG